MTVTVAMPYYGCPDLVGRAVRSVLDQSVRDLVLVVVGDGETPPLADVRDPRLVVYRLPANRGPYFAQEVVLEATPHAWYAPHAADDWTDRDHLAHLLATAQRHNTNAVLTGVVWFHKNGKVTKHRSTYEVGIFTPAALLDLGGHNPAERMGQDTLMIKLLRMTGRPVATRQPTYHRWKWPGSLMSSPATRPGSLARNEMRARNRAILAECARLADVAAIRAYRRGLVPTQVAEEVAYHAAQLRVRLTKEVAA